MSDELNENLDSSNQATEEVVNTEVEATSADEGTEDLETLQEKNKKLFERAKKAEAEAKLLKAERLKAEERAKVKPEPSSNVSVSIKDQIAIVNAKIHEDDVEDVMEYAKFKNIPIAEALKSNVVMATLKDKAEQRRTAEVTNTSGSKRVNAKVTDDALLAKADKGDLPESEDDIERLIDARISGRIKK